MNYEKLNKNAKKSWFISRLIGLIVMGAVIIIGRMILKNEFDWANKYIFFTNLGSILLIGSMILDCFIYPIIEYKQWGYCITDDKVEFQEGVFTIKKTIIPIVRIQHIKVNQGPINRIFKLADVEIVTAGGEHKIPNIEIERAEEISEYLKTKIRIKVEDTNDIG